MATKTEIMIAMMMTLLLPVRRRLLAIPYHRRCTTTTPTLRTCTRLLLSSIFVAALLIGINPDSTNISTGKGTSTSTSTIATTPIIIEAFSPTPITINNYNYNNNNNNNNNERGAVTSISVSLFLSSLGSTAEEQEQQIRKTTTITTTAMDNPDSSSNTRWEKEETGTKISITLPSFAPPSINSIAAINDLDTNDAYLLSSSSSSSSSSRLLHQLHIRSILSTKEVDQVLHLALEHAELNRSFDTPDTDRHVSYSTCDFPVEECAQLQQYLEYDCHFTQRILQHFQRLYNITASASPTSTSIEEEEEDVDDHIDDTVLSFDDLFVAYYEAKNNDDDDDTNNSSTNKGATNTNDIMDRLELHRDGPLLSFSLLLNPPEEFTGGGTFYDALRDVDIDAVNVDTSVKNIEEGKQQQQQEREHDVNMVKPDTDNSKKKKEDPHHGYCYCYRDDNEKGQEDDNNPDDNNDTDNRREDKKKKILYPGGIIRPSRAGDAVLHWYVICMVYLYCVVPGLHNAATPLLSLDFFWDDYIFSRISLFIIINVFVSLLHTTQSHTHTQVGRYYTVPILLRRDGE